MNKVLLIGDSCTDVFIYGTCTRICPEAPVPLILETGREYTQGMASNVAHNFTQLGVSYDMITNTGEILKTRYIDTLTSQMMFRADKNDFCDPINSSKLRAIDWSKYTVVAISDYCKGFLSTSDISYITANHQSVFLDTKKILGSWVLGVTTLKVNETEYQNNKNFLDTQFPQDKLIITLGKDGCRYNGRNYPTTNYTRVINSSGAGDAFFSGLIQGYLKTNNLIEAITPAQHWASKAVANITTGL